MSRLSLHRRNRGVVTAGAIAALYAAATLLANQVLGVFSWGPVQLRVSEALTVLPLFTSAAAPGLGIGCALANLLNMGASGAGPISLLDVVFGTLATVLGALWTRRLRRRPLLALAGPVLANALIVAAYLPVMLRTLGAQSFYTIPFTHVSFAQSWPFMYLFGFVSIAAGEALVVYGLGYPLTLLFRRLNILRPEDEQSRS
ncbi:MAG: QueT transporter family protein [Actinomycetia bacterium]|nr:QueT transporter family protein [Actinomycetes bacterium]